tara:strand:+ start:4816 stop:5034 length:219 start_codon:yes stop_codon:yes gene_type:complete
MKRGDLVRVKRNDTDIRDRDAGIVIKFDTYNGREEIVEVLWNNGHSWILRKRLEIVNTEKEIIEMAMSFAYA